MRKSRISNIPYTDKGYLLFGSNTEETKAQFIKHFSIEDYDASRKLEAELEAFRQDVGPTWLMV